MAKFNIEMNPGWEKALEDQMKKGPQWVHIQQDFDEKARAIVREVNQRMTGKAVSEVLSELVARFKIAGFKPNRETLREFATAISEGTLK